MRTAGLKVRQAHRRSRPPPPPSTTPLSKALTLLADDFTRQTVCAHSLFMWGEQRDTEVDETNQWVKLSSHFK